jgi:hypothetical protein
MRDEEGIQNIQKDRELGPGVLALGWRCTTALLLLISSLYSTSFPYLYSLRPYSFTIL